MVTLRHGDPKHPLQDKHFRAPIRTSRRDQGRDRIHRRPRPRHEGFEMSLEGPSRFS